MVWTKDKDHWFRRKAGRRRIRAMGGMRGTERSVSWAKRPLPHGVVRCAPIGWLGSGSARSNRALLQDLSRRLLRTPEACSKGRPTSSVHCDNRTGERGHRSNSCSTQRSLVDGRFDQCDGPLALARVRIARSDPPRAHPEWRSDHSPTQRVGLEITENAKQIDHLQPMLSLANSYNEKDLVDFDLQIKKLYLISLEELRN